MSKTGELRFASFSFKMGSRWLVVAGRAALRRGRRSDQMDGAGLLLCQRRSVLVDARPDAVATLATAYPERDGRRLALRPLDWFGRLAGGVATPTGYREPGSTHAAVAPASPPGLSLAGDA